MQLTREAQGFQKVTLVIETQEELDWLYALSNSSVTEARRLALSLSISLSGNPDRAQMALFNALQTIYTK